MRAFETDAILDDASHLTLHEPVPSPSARNCRVIVLFDSAKNAPARWPAGFFDEIFVADPAFARPPQGDLPPVPTLSS